MLHIFPGVGISDDGTSNHSNPYDFLTPGYGKLITSPL